MPAQMFKCVASVVPPPQGFIPPVLWGDEDTVRERLGENFTDIRLTRRVYPKWRYNFGAADLVDLFRSHFGPVKRAFETVYETDHAELHRHLEEIFEVNSKTKNGILTITNGEYLEVIATRR
jgi:hypothetical protein